MEDICRICRERADVTCKCNKDIRFCLKCMVNHLEAEKGQHKALYLSVLRTELYNKCKSNLEKIDQVKSSIIRRSKDMIRVILQITNTQLSKILNNYNQIKKIFKSNRFSDEITKMVEEYGNIEIKESELNDFTEIGKNYLSLLINKSDPLPPAINLEQIKNKIKKLEEKANTFKALKIEIKNFKSELQNKTKKLDEPKKIDNKNIILSNNHEVSSIVKELERDYKLFLEGHSH